MHSNTDNDEINICWLRRVRHMARAKIKKQDQIYMLLYTMAHKLKKKSVYFHAWQEFVLLWSRMLALFTRATSKVGWVIKWVFYLSIYLSIYRRVTIIHVYADVMHVIDTFMKTRRRSTKTHSLLSNGRLRGETWCKRTKFDGYYAQYTWKVTHRSR